MKEWLDIVSKASQNAIEQVLIFVPKLIGALLLLIVGFLVAKLIEKVFQKVFNLLGLNRVAKKSGISGIMQSFGIKIEFGEILAKLLFWVIIFVFLLPVSEILSLSFFADLVNQIIAFLPNIFIALVILLAGSWAAKVLSGLARGSAARVGSEYAEVTEILINMLIMLITIVIALFQLQIEIEILSYLILSLFGAFSFGLALAFALGVKDIIRLIVTTAYLHKSLTTGDIVKLENTEGTVIEIGNFFTVIETETGKIKVPNTQIIKQ